MPPNAPDISAPSPQKKEKHNRYREFCSNANYFAKKWKHAIELAGLIAILVYCGLNAGELWVFNRERITMDREFFEGETNSQEQLNVMQGQFQEMQRTRMDDERAWISVSHVVPERREYSERETFFTVEFRNSGKTPAIKVVEWHDSGYGVPKDKEWSALSPTNTNWHDFSGMVGPDATWSFNTADKEINDNEADYLKGHPTAAYFVYGKIWYQDIFGTNHWTEFCYAISLYPKFNAWPMTTHNSCDETQRN